MYLEHFGLTALPFSLSPNTGFYCELPAYQEALEMAAAAIEQEEGFIKIIGEVGLGKTTLCRQLLKALDSDVVFAYLPNPNLEPQGLKRALARELSLEVASDTDAEELTHLLVERLCALHAQGLRVILVIDEAQAMSDETLEAVRLLSNIETESAKLVQVILCAQPELNVRLKQPGLRQLQQRILFSYHLRALTKTEMSAYINHRLFIAGHRRVWLFKRKALKMIYQASQGVPRVVNALCHKALLAAYGNGRSYVGAAEVKVAINDSGDLIHTVSPKSRRFSQLIAAVVLGVAAITLAWLLSQFHY